MYSFFVVFVVVNCCLGEVQSSIGFVVVLNIAFMDTRKRQCLNQAFIHFMQDSFTNRPASQMAHYHFVKTFPKSKKSKIMEAETSCFCYVSLWFLVLLNVIRPHFQVTEGLSLVQFCAKLIISWSNHAGIGLKAHGQLGLNKRVLL